VTDSLGARLRYERERRQIALRSIAEGTKISISLLEGLERDDVSHWPSGIFRRSFIRSYAEAVGLEAEPVVRDFLARYPDPVDVFAERPSSSTSPARDEQPAGEAPTRLGLAVRKARVSFGPRLRNAIGRLKGNPAISPGITPTRDEEMSAPAVQPSASRVDLKPLDPPEPRIDWPAAAHICTRLGQVVEARELPALLEDVVSSLGAAGVMLWLRDQPGSELALALASGYPDKVLSLVSRVRHDAPNATAIAFREGQTRIVSGGAQATGGVAIPLVTPSGCVGVFGVELRDGREQDESVRALATIFAAQLASRVSLLGVSTTATAASASSDSVQPEHPPRRESADGGRRLTRLAKRLR
jgi:transcriptional regulator with XRE-family HTH domain